MNENDQEKITPAVLVSLLIFLLLVGVSIYAGAARWPVWSVLLLALGLTLNKTNVRAMGDDISWSKGQAIFIVNFPILTVFAAVFYGLGLGFSALFSS